MLKAEFLLKSECARIANPFIDTQPYCLPYSDSGFRCLSFCRSLLIHMRRIRTSEPWSLLVPAKDGFCH